MSDDEELVKRINAAAKDAVDGLIDADGKRRKWGKEEVARPMDAETPTDKDRAVSKLLESNLDRLQKLEDKLASKICMPCVDLSGLTGPTKVKLPDAK